MGGRQEASGVGRNCCFWRAACFRSEVSSWNERRVQYFLIKAQHYPRDPQQRQTGLLANSCPSGREGEGEGGRGRERDTMFSEDMTSQALFSAGFVAPPQITSAPLKSESCSLPNNGNVCNEHRIWENTLNEASGHLLPTLKMLRWTVVSFIGPVWYNLGESIIW